MIKFYNHNIVFREIPDKVTLAINITNCQNNCYGCHSSYLRSDIGEELTDDKITQLIEDNKGIDCVVLMGEGDDHQRIIEIGNRIKQENLLVGVYSGRNEVEDEYYLTFDYIKLGPYIEEFGGLDKKTTNQKLLQRNKHMFLNITKKIQNI